MLLILFLFVINPLHADGDECSLVDECNRYFKSMTETFVDPEVNDLVPYCTYVRVLNHYYLPYRNINCLTFIMYGSPAVCDFTKFALPIDTASCRYVREKMTFEDTIDQDRSAKIVEERTVASQVGYIDNQLMTQYDIDSDDVCEQLHWFNNKPKSEKTKQKWAELYNITGKYLTYIYVSALHFYQVDKYVDNLGDCILDIDSKARIFFGNLEAPKTE